MTNEDVNKKTTSRRGVERYQTNPFVQIASGNTKGGVKRITDKSGHRMMVVSEGTGEIVAPAGFYEISEVDRTQFVKLYINGVKAFKDLSSAGTRVFEVLYLKVRENPGKDQLWINYHSIDQTVTPMAESTFHRGMRELLSKDFIAESTVPALYFLNPDYIWNGDRLAFVKEFRLKGSSMKDQAVRERLEEAGQMRLDELTNE